MSDSAHQSVETWIGVIHLLADGDTFALAWVRRRDEWLADAGMASREQSLAELARMYREAVDKRGHPPARLNVRAAMHADALRDLLGAEIAIEIGFDDRAEALSDAAASAVDVAFGAAEALSNQGIYDPDRAPDPVAWLALSKDERQQHVCLAHLARGTEMRGQHLQLHAGMHDAVETQLALDDPPAVASTLARLQADGLGRHAAIHAISAVLMRKMHDVLASGGPFDVDAYVVELNELDATPAEP